LCSEFEKNDCHEFAFCIPDDQGGYTCECRTGFAGDGRHCEDVDECELGTAQCPEHATCRNTVGSYECDCNEGFERQGHYCVDIDECATNTDDCAPRHAANCINTIGGYYCTCKEGFVGNGHECKDDSKPSLELHGTNPLHLELFDSFAEPGYTVQEPTNHPDEVSVRVRYPPELDTFALACGKFTVEYTLLEQHADKKVEIALVKRSVIVASRSLCDFDRKNDPVLLEYIPLCPKYSKCVDLECAYDCVCYPGYVKQGNECVDRLAPIIELRPEVDPYPVFECRVCNIAAPVDLSQPLEKVFAYDPQPDGSRAPVHLELERFEVDKIDPSRAVHHYIATDAAGNVARRAVNIEVRVEDVRERIDHMWTFLNENFAEFRKQVDENQRNTNRLSTFTYWVLGVIAIAIAVQLLFIVSSKSYLLLNVVTSDRATWSDFEEAWSFWYRITHPMWSSADITAAVFRKVCIQGLVLFTLFVH
jgi:hypothetical protein